MPTIPINDPYTELVILLLAAAVVGVIALRLRQPLIIGFIIVGILIGPAGLKFIRSEHQIHMFAEMGLALLLFVVGLKLDLHLIRSLGPVAMAAGIGQVLITAIGGYLIALVLGLSPLVSLYIAVALTFSSTIIVVKLLSDKRETDALHGRIALGVLIVQDIVVVLAMIGLSVSAGPTVLQPGAQALQIVAKGAGLFLTVWIVGYLIFPRLLPLIARSAELLVLFGIVWALALALLGEKLGFSAEVGAFAAGISLASTTYRDILSAKLVSLRDFLLLFFFLELGSRLKLDALGAQVALAIPLVLFVLIFKPLIVMGIMRFMGYRKRTGFMTGLSLAQISEFSLILVALGATAGHLNDDAVGVVTLVGLVTIGVSTSLIISAQPLYDRLAPYLAIFERKVTHREDPSLSLLPRADDNTVILIGLGNYGSNIGGHLTGRGRRVVGVDFDPQAVSRWNAGGGMAVFGDAGDPDFAHALPLSTARWVISSIRDPQINRSIVSVLRHEGYPGLLALAAENRTAVPSVSAEADLLFVPFEDAAEQAVDLLFREEEHLERIAMDKQIELLHDHYIVCGYGRMGQQIVKDFRRAGVPFVVIEDNPEQLPRLKEHRVPHVVGEAAQDEILLRAGIDRAKGLIAVASSDEENVFIVLSARGLNQKLNIVARSIREENEDKLRRAGADHVMSPYILGGRRMAAAVTKPGVMDFLDLVIHSEKFDTEIGHVAVPPGAVYADRTLRDLALWQACGVLVLAVERPGEDLLANPGPDFAVREQDELIIMGTTGQITAARQYLAQTENTPDPVQG
jgi:Kef-type K+ transport system membrane component KefB/Trk K+ transport system NAD-binding subunit